ncbi:MAG: contact-dependent growth inhibition system immunity protein [Pseudomonadota bacterium]
MDPKNAFERRYENLLTLGTAYFYQCWEEDYDGDIDMVLDEFFDACASTPKLKQELIQELKGFLQEFPSEDQTLAALEKLELEYFEVDGSARAFIEYLITAAKQHERRSQGFSHKEYMNRRRNKMSYERYLRFNRGRGQRLG